MALTLSYWDAACVFNNGNGLIVSAKMIRLCLTDWHWFYQHAYSIVLLPFVICIHSCFGIV